jgi:hypothetical protein
MDDGSTANPNIKIANPNKKNKIIFLAKSRKSKQKNPLIQTKKSQIQT